jgi:RNA polymerase sigma-70 factor (ECF subfamily)
MRDVTTPGSQGQRWTGLLLRAQRGETQLFGELVGEMEPVLARRLRSCPATAAVGRNAHDTDEALQEAFLRAWRRLNSYDPARGSAGAWVWAITRNCALDILRRRSRKRTVSLNGGDGDGMEQGQDGLNPAAAAETRERAETVRRLLARLLPGQKRGARRAWELRFGKGLSYRAIASRLCVPQGTVATWIHRVRQEVRTALAGCET